MASPRTCPSWCTNGEDCRGEHLDAKTFVPATGGATPYEVDANTGAIFPVIGTGLDYSEVEGAVGPSVVVWLTGPGIDRDVLLRPAEARALAQQLLARVQAAADG